MMISWRHLSTIESPPPLSLSWMPDSKKAGIAPGLSQSSDGVGWYALPTYFASARLGGEAGHDLISVS